MLKTSEGESVIEFGPKRLQLVPFASINELPQVRTTYDPSAIEELAQAIWTDRGTGAISTDDFDLANPLLVGRHTPTSAKRYIHDHGEYHRIAKADRMDPQDLTPLDNDTAIIMIAGHRRRRAISHLLGQHNILPGDVRVAGNVRDDIEFGQAIGLQLRENVYERPSPQDEARAIDLAFRYIQTKSGHVPSLKSLSTELGFGETKVRDAIAFASLPDSIQEYTNSGALSYTITRQLKPLYDVFIRYYKLKPDAEKDPVITAEFAVREFCDSHLNKRIQGKSDERISQLIAGQVKSIEDSIKYQQGSWDFDLDMSPESRSRRAGRQLTQTALAVMRYRLTLGEMSSTDISELERLIEAHRRNETPKQDELPLGLSEAS